MDIKLIQKNGEKLALFTCFALNRKNELLDYHRKVTDYLNIPVNYLEIDYSTTNHGLTLEWLTKGLINEADYLIFLDVDCIPLNREFINNCYNHICDKQTLYGGIQSANHKDKTHCYVGAYFMCLSTKLYKDLDCPTFNDHLLDCDTGEFLTREAERLGKNICFANVNSFSKLTKEEQELSGNPEYWNLGNGQKFGMGSTLGNTVFHAFMASVPRSKELFIQKAKKIIGEDKKIEAIIVCKNYSDYLELTLPENKKYFHNVIVVTDEFDGRTQKVCEDNGVECVIYDGFNKNGAKFNFGGARQFGLNYLKYSDWVVFLDSDIVIKEDFRSKLIDKNKFYGSYRRFIPSLKEFKLLNQVAGNFTNYKEIEGSGCGFFQCLNMENLNLIGLDKQNLYKDSFSAEQVDIDFLRQFCPFTNNQYHNLVRMNIELWHLGPHGVNNNGRSERDIFFNA